jgi:hypothetical protein
MIVLFSRRIPAGFFQGKMKIFLNPISDIIYLFPPTAVFFHRMNDRAASRNETPKNLRSKLRGIPHPAKAG